ncbi:MAG: hypothetical protein KJ072_27350 [Verrucomicrobia bacterium]|nr:hypothetical protein [Verrucomicrobiota bacterium]
MKPTKRIFRAVIGLAVVSISCHLLAQTSYSVGETPAKSTHYKLVQTELHSDHSPQFEDTFLSFRTNILASLTSSWKQQALEVWEWKSVYPNPWIPVIWQTNLWEQRLYQGSRQTRKTETVAWIENGSPQQDGPVVTDMGQSWAEPNRSLVALTDMLYFDMPYDTWTTEVAICGFFYNTALVPPAPTYFLRAKNNGVPFRDSAETARGAGLFKNYTPDSNDDYRDVTLDATLTID